MLSIECKDFIQCNECWTGYFRYSSTTRLVNPISITSVQTRSSDIYVAAYLKSLSVLLPVLYMRFIKMSIGICLLESFFLACSQNYEKLPLVFLACSQNYEKRPLVFWRFQKLRKTTISFFGVFTKLRKTTISFFWRVHKITKNDD